MRPISELPALGFASFKDYLCSEDMRCDSAQSSSLRCADGVVTLGLSGAQREYESFFLLFRDERRSLAVAGDREGDRVQFDLAPQTGKLLETQGKWLCYLGMECTSGFTVARLRVNGEAVALLPKPEPVKLTRQQRVKQRLHGLLPARKGAMPPLWTGTLPPFRLWSERERYYDTGLSGTDGDRLLLRAHSLTRRISLCRCPQEEAQQMLSGAPLHRCRDRQRIENFPFLFSIIMAIYNVEPYLEEAIESVVQQDIGFRKHVQLILVDDGSTDGSGALCQRYAERFPDNVVVIRQANAGASAARNAGKAAASGRYLNFLDSDDKLSLNTLSAVARFFDSFADQTDVACIPMFFFEARFGDYWQNYKFDRGTRVVDLWREPLVSDMSASSSFFRAQCVRDLDFVSIPQGEDILFVTQAVLGRMQLGVVSEAAYWYRRRRAGDSRVNTANVQPGWYTDCLSQLSFALLDQCRERFGFVPAYVLNTLVMDLRWRFKPHPEPGGGLSAAQRSAYRKSIVRLLSHIDAQTLISRPELTLPELWQIFTLKHGHAPNLVSGANDLHVLMEGRRLFSCAELPVHLERITLDEKALCLEGFIRYPGAPQFRQPGQYLILNGNYYPCEALERHSGRVNNSFGCVEQSYGFRVRLPLREEYLDLPIRLVSVVEERPVIHHIFHYEPACPFYGGVQGQYLWGPGAVLIWEKSCLRLKPSGGDRSSWERAYCVALKKLERTPERQKRSVALPKDLTRERLEQVLALRAGALAAKRERPLWLLCDAPEAAGGPAEELLHSLLQWENCPARFRFVLREDSPDFRRLSDLGVVLPYGSQEHLRAHLEADALFFSREREELLSPFSGTAEGFALRRYYADLLSAQRWFLLCPQGQAAPSELAEKYPLELLPQAPTRAVLLSIASGDLPAG